MFLLNLALCSLLGCALIAMRMNGNDEPEPLTETTQLTAAPQRSAIECINLVGQAYGLSDDPRVTLPYKDEQLAIAAQNAIKMLKETHSTHIESDQALIAAYIEGYHARFGDYYSQQEGYDAGYLLGIKTDPTKYRGLATQRLNEILEHDRSLNPEKYPHDEAEWILFKQGYDSGYSKGYLRTEEGVTLEVLRKLEL